MQGLTSAVERGLAEQNELGLMARAGRLYLLRHNTPASAAEGYEAEFASFEPAMPERPIAPM